VIAGAPRPPLAPPEDDGLFPPDGMVRRITRERVMLLGGPRALLLQIAHPMVAAGVADHSGFGRDPWERLWSTLDVVLDVVFGDTVRAGAAASRVTALHHEVSGSRDGIDYRALDPGLLLWVHATLVDSALVTYERFVAPLSAGSAEAYYREMKRFAAAFRVPPEIVPDDLAEFRGYFRKATADLRVTPEARRLADRILEPPVPAMLVSVRSVQNLITAGLLPPLVRTGYGLPWSAGRERALRVASASIRRTLPLLPAKLRRWPHSFRES